MDLTIKDVARLLNVTESTVYQWLEEGEVPAYQIAGEYRFNRPEIEDWIMQRHLAEEGKEVESPEGQISTGSLHFSLYRAIHRGNVIHNVPGETKEEVIQNCVSTIAEPLNLDAEFISGLLLERENLQPTGLNHGIGIPHTRDFLLDDHYDVVTVAFPKVSLEYGSLDSVPVHTLFFLFASEDKNHLHLLAKIAHLSNSPRMRQLLESKPTKSALLGHIKDWEAKMQQAQLVGQSG